MRPLTNPAMVMVIALVIALHCIGHPGDGRDGQVACRQHPHPPHPHPHLKHGRQINLIPHRIKLSLKLLSLS